MRRSRKYPIRFGIENLSFVLNGFIEVLLPLLYADKSCGSRRLEKLRQRVYSFGFVRAVCSDLYLLSLTKAEGDDPEKTFRIDASLTGDYADGALKDIGVIAAATVLVSLAVTEPLVSIFARPGTPVYDLAVAGNRICSLALLFVGFNIFASGMFTALSNGLISAVLAFSRTFVFTVIAMLALPALLGVTGIWLATPAAELAAIILSAVMLLKYRRRYCY